MFRQSGDAAPYVSSPGNGAIGTNQPLEFGDEPGNGDFDAPPRDEAAAIEPMADAVPVESDGPEDGPTGDKPKRGGRRRGGRGRGRGTAGGAEGGPADGGENAPSPVRAGATRPAPERPAPERAAPVRASRPEPATRAKAPSSSAAKAPAPKPAAGGSGAGAAKPRTLYSSRRKLAPGETVKPPKREE